MLNLQVSYCSINLPHSGNNQKLQLSPASVHGISPLDVVVYLMSDGALEGQRCKAKVYAQVICSC